MNDARRRLFAMILMIAGGIIFLGAGGAYYLMNRPVTPQFPRVGTRMTGFTLTDVQGHPVHLSDYAGKTVLINTWATWCPPCQEEMPMLVNYYNSTRPNGIALISINAGDTAADALAFAQDYGMTFPILLDPNSDFLFSIRVDSLPTTILVGPDGVVRALHVGLMSEEIFNQEILAKIPR